MADEGSPQLATAPEDGNTTQTSDRSADATGTPTGRRDDDSVDIRLALFNAAAALDLLQQRRHARALRRLRGSLEYMRRTTYGFFMDLGLSPRRVLPNPEATDMRSKAYAASTGPPTAAPSERPRGETRRQRKNREWRERCRRRDQERAERRAYYAAAEDADAPARGTGNKQPETVGTAAAPQAKGPAVTDDGAQLAEDQAWVEVVDSDAATMMAALDKALEAL